MLESLKLNQLFTSIVTCDTLPFVTTYLCEAGFYALVVMKTKLRARLDVGSDIRVAISKTTPRIKHIVENKQEHPSHHVWLLAYQW